MSQTTTKERRSAIDDLEADLRDPDAGMPPAVIPVEPHTLAVLSRSEIDAQTERADHKPRSIDFFRRTLREIALMNEESAAECIYALPGRAKSDGTKGDPIEGASIRFAEIACYAWGHCRVGARVIEEGMAHVTAQGMFSDLQANVVTTSELRRRITGRSGRRYSQDMINMTANAACSLAKRNAVLGGIPRALWWDIYRECRAVSVGAGDLSKLNQRRDAAITYAQQKLNVAEDRVLLALGVDRREQIGIDELALLRGTFTAIRDGEASVDEAFPKPAAEKPADQPGSTAEILDKFAAGSSSPSPDPSREVAPAAGGSDIMPTSGSAPAGADRNAAPAGPASELDAKASAIAWLIDLAAGKSLTDQEKLEQLDLRRPVFAETLPPAFVDEAIAAAAKWIRGELKPAAARKYLEGL